MAKAGSIAKRQHCKAAGTILITVDRSTIFNKHFDRIKMSIIITHCNQRGKLLVASCRWFINISICVECQQQCHKFSTLLCSNHRNNGVQPPLLTASTRAPLINKCIIICMSSESGISSGCSIAMSSLSD